MDNRINAIQKLRERLINVALPGELVEPRYSIMINGYLYRCQKCKEQKSYQAYNNGYYRRTVCDKCRGAETKEKRRKSNSFNKKLIENHFEFDNVDEI